ncbi:MULTISPECIES: bifunctional phosphopantothenoylcysteine decarboxylase/phosphopantothenate--cysteine ligase CoaBC [Nocardiopsis]|uniref:Coenzyme A biosynthesis bifunctional protein CoaBC n=2 Tax=Nocardiopsis alba TaxID=53437 RepID=A0A7K2IML0_9ACTN|nr:MULTISPECIES: bifunctional phosphopantothenoylcysteine decarboxylase/phosphopantothenate--cysteine ligase CoaBC [Nocardiopsis]AFR07311.1 phosphopantothenoylcysteine decarboxylase / phosphopantothenate--cysteine ligase [Nocardiopsis alba ATCC BAA-2165]MEC3895578.1 bifunctional phosphopantothenoylcysteine decarboxylase/phosphopantothenate--cysteine ligase CoaBC [Nocardiopsis sp. LDBS1602]MYR31199.1 bifunctional phosphopantothenoylcysteine decarboxylase/phosphopantothenate--cysteine ligase CoaBC
MVLGVGGGIAAYKVCELLRRLTESGHGVQVVPTDAALRFVGEPTWAALSGRPVETGVWDRVHEVPHVRIGQNADLVFVAPATADIMAKAAAGIADDLLTNTLLTARCPVVFAPAMHTEMWEHPATRANVETLRSRGAVVLEPAVGRLTGADTGRGRLPDPSELFEAARLVLRRGAVAPDLAGRRVVISAGGTREAIDPVRFIGNHSSGRQGYALARTAAARGADVTLVAANVDLPDPAGARVVRVSSAVELSEAMAAERAGADAVVMTAAVADFRPVTSAASKIKKSGAAPAPIELVENPDILAGLVVDREREGLEQTIVGFAAETDDVIANGRAKLARKGCDLLVVNQVGGGRAFGTEDNQATVLASDGAVVDIPTGPKEALADRVWDLVVERLPRGAR